MLNKLSQQVFSLFSATDNSQRRGKLTNSSIVPPSSILVASFLVTGIVMGVRQTSLLQEPELRAFDSMVQRLDPSPPDPRILVVGITEADIRNQKRWPISDSTIAQLLKVLQKINPKLSD